MFLSRKKQNSNNSTILEKHIASPHQREEESSNLVNHNFVDHNRVMRVKEIQKNDEISILIREYMDNKKQ